MPIALREIYQLKISLVGAKPPIWRRFLVESTIELSTLHEIIQIIMGWTNSHLHQFVAGNLSFGVPDPEFDLADMLDERDYTLNLFLNNEKDSIGYDYDFGDGWEHEIALEKVLPFELDAVLPLCIKGKGACPPEDVGGLWGYYEFLEALKDPKHPEYEMHKEWIGRDFDPEAFDISGGIRHKGSKRTAISISPLKAGECVIEGNC